MRTWTVILAVLAIAVCSCATVEATDGEHHREDKRDQVIPEGGGAHHVGR